MAKKKKSTGSRKPKKKAPKKKAVFKENLNRMILGLSILVLLVAAAGILTHRLLRPRQPEKTAAAPKAVMPDKAPSKKAPPVSIPTYEVYPEEHAVSPPPLEAPTPSSARPLPKVAVIIDDMGYDLRFAKKIVALDPSFTLSFLPYGPFNDKILRLAGEMGVETMLHLPMEPKEYPKIKPGPGALYTSMTPDSLIAQLEADLRAVPGVKGVNNHMGSKMTSNSSQLYQIFSILKKKGLYFVDSKTTPDSICEPSARLFKVPFGERDVFIDHIQERPFIANQIELLIRIAEKYGSAIGIAHPHELTYNVLKDMMPEIKKRVRMVPASQLVE